MRSARTPFAPIALFAYRRTGHLAKTLAALANNTLAAQSDLIVFSDGPKRREDRESVENVRRMIGEAKGFASVRLIQREENWGVAKSILQGLDDILAVTSRVIVLEDDLVTSPFFLRYMNDALDLYAEEEKVATVSGYAFPIPSRKLPETYFLGVGSSWGWGTWRRSWIDFNPDGAGLLARIIADADTVRKFNLDCSYDYYSDMLMGQVKGRNDSWAVRFYASCFLKGKISLFPRHSLVENIGYDGSGVHCDERDFSAFHTKAHQASVRVEQIPAEENRLARSLLTRHFLARVRTRSKNRWKALRNRLQFALFKT